MIDKLYKALASEALNGVKHITVALSGGKDSMALLHGLLALKNDFGFTVSAAHFNHLLRGEESFRDEDFVKQKCKELGVELIVERGDVNGYAQENKLSIEQAARDMRYDFFSRVNKGVIATAHTATDNIETLLLHIVRGSGLDGLCGIPFKRDYFIRPLLSVSSEEILNYCNENGIEYVTDSTNLTDMCQRNFLRHNVIPLIKELNPSLEAAVCRLTNAVGEDKRFIEKIVKETYNSLVAENGLDVSKLENSEDALISRIIIMFLENNNFSVSSMRVEQLKEIIFGGGKLTFDNGRSVCVKNGMLFEAKSEQKSYVFNTELIKKDASFFKKDGKINNLLLKNAIDCDKIEGKLTVRTWLSGDSITFSHRNVTKPLKKLFSEDKIDMSLRKALPVIADDKGVVWVYSYGVDKRVCADENTKTVYNVVCKKEE